MAHDIKRLEEKINQLNRSISDLAKLPPGFGGVIHNPGWTTLPEFMLVEAGIDSLCKQIDNATEHCQRLLKAAEIIGTHS